MTADPSDAPTVGLLLVTTGTGRDLLAGTGPSDLDGVARYVLTTAETSTVEGVVSAREQHPSLGAGSGRGSAVWAGLHTSADDVLVIVDADRHGLPTSADVSALAATITDDVQLALGATAAGEPLVDVLLRPALALHHPHLMHLVNPRPSIWAVRRDNLEMLPVPIGEGAELAALLDTDNLFGVDAIAEVSVEAAPTATGRPPLSDAVQLLTVLERRLPQRMPVSEDPVALPGQPGQSVRVDECPPAAALPGYLDRLRQLRAVRR